MGSPPSWSASEARVVQTIVTQGPITVTRLSAVTGLSLMTTLLAVQKLLAAGDVTALGDGFYGR